MKPVDPTPDEIAERAAVIRAGWTQNERESRRADADKANATDTATGNPVSMLEPLKN